MVAGLQDGVWPNLRLRGSLLHPQELVRAVLGVDEASLDERKLVLDDELRHVRARGVPREARGWCSPPSSTTTRRRSPFFALLPPLTEPAGARTLEAADPAGA